MSKSDATERGVGEPKEKKSNSMKKISISSVKQTQTGDARHSPRYAQPVDHTNIHHVLTPCPAKQVQAAEARPSR